MATTEQIANEYYEKGMAQVFNNNIEPGIDNLNMALSIYDEIGYEAQYIMAMRGLAIGYGILGYDSKMLSKCLNGLQFADKHSIRGAKHFFYTTICNRYMLLGDYDGAIAYGLMAMQDIESYGPEFENPPSAYLVVYLNLCYCYINIHRYNEAELYFKRACDITKKNDMNHHDFTLKVLNARLHLASGDQQFIIDNTDDLMSCVKSLQVTIQDYLQDLYMLCDTFLLMNDYDHAIAVAQNLKMAADGALDNSLMLKLESAKLFMRIYKKENDMVKYHEACVVYAETAIELNDAQTEKKLLDMDTSIALSIADTPIDLL
ncbi:MAG: tetratricopeptide repeat protein [Pseudobutyrivibrio sp.]|nr:tetratricopeptide repeat protein [Pseudobutyrivibrio sp.]